MSWYLTVRPDDQYSGTTPTGPLVEFLRGLPELVRVGPMEFRSAPGMPWVSLLLAVADRVGNYASSGEPLPTVNVVSVVYGAGDEQRYWSLAARVAAFLGWETVEE
jgi:hypothetical protein